MGIVSWIVLGLVAGFIASKIVNRKGEGIIFDVLIGVIGAVIGGWVMSTFGGRGVSGINFYSMAVATGGAIVLLIAYRFARSLL